jgi:hypothetical protein
MLAAQARQRVEAICGDPLQQSPLIWIDPQRLDLSSRAQA